MVLVGDIQRRGCHDLHFGGVWGKSSFLLFYLIDGGKVFKRKKSINFKSEFCGNHDWSERVLSCWMCGWVAGSCLLVKGGGKRENPTLTTLLFCLFPSFSLFPISAGD